MEKEAQIIHAIEIITDLIITISTLTVQKTWSDYDKNRLKLLQEIADRL